jgi:two-component system sensor histidine kinase UhpB
MVALTGRMATSREMIRTIASSAVQRIWYDRPVRWQILLAFLFITVLATIVAGMIIVFDARDRAEVEMRAPIELAARFVQETTRNLSSEEDVQRLPRMLAAQLRHLRHLKIVVLDAAGNAHTMPADAGRKDGELDPIPVVPEWFAGLVTTELEPRRIDVNADGKRVATVLIAGEPAYEIAEVWDDLSTLAALWLGANALMMAVLYAVLGHILNPLVTLASGMRRLEDGHFELRLAPSKVREIGAITGRFNKLAAALGATREENDRLYRDLVSVQEEERRLIANELHDEVGPCLFGITVNASSIGKQCEQMGSEQTQQVANRIAEILSIAERLKNMNRGLLKRLRPVALGRITLTELVAELITEFERRYPGTHFRYTTQGLAKSYGEHTDLTLYRAIQEGMTNALRHAQASEIVVTLAQDTPGDDGDGVPAKIVLSLADNGKGITPSTPIGFGLRTMRERVRAQGGTFSVVPNMPVGTIINITIPVPAPMSKAERVEELAETTP